MEGEDKERRGFKSSRDGLRRSMSSPALLPGWSSLATSERTRLRRAALAARTSSELLRDSAMTVVRNELSPAWTG